MNKNNVIQVFYDGKVVGLLAMRGHSTSFEYDDDSDAFKSSNATLVITVLE